MTTVLNQPVLTGKFSPAQTQGQDKLVLPVIAQVCKQLGLSPGEYMTNNVVGGMSIKRPDGKCIFTLGIPGKVITNDKGKLAVVANIHIHTGERSKVNPDFLTVDGKVGAFAPKVTFLHSAWKLTSPVEIEKDITIGGQVLINVENVMLHIRNFAPGLIPTPTK